MTTSFLRFTAATFLVAALAAPELAPAASNVVKAELVAKQASFAPGKTLQVGVLYTISPQWHIYWKNPGESGLPTKINFTLPTGVKLAGELQYPAPIAFTSEGNVTSYGYSGEVLLIQNLAVDASFAGETLDIQAKSSWLQCAERCEPNKNEKLSISLPKGDGAAGAMAQAFETYAASVPSKQPKGAKAKVTSTATAKSAGKIELAVTVDAGSTPLLAATPGAHDAETRGLAFFPHTVKGLSGATVAVPAPNGEAGGKPAHTGKTTITTQWEVGGSDAAKTVGGVLVYQAANGSPVFQEVSAAVK